MSDQVIYEIYETGGGYWSYEFRLTQEQINAISLKPGMGKVFPMFRYERKNKAKVERRAQKLANRVAEYVCAHRKQKEIESRRTQHTVEVKCG